MRRAAILSLSCLLGSAVSLQGQDLWDSSLKLSAGAMSGADKAGLGQNKTYALGIAGAYPLTRSQVVVFEGGYRVFPTATQASPGMDIDEKTDGYFFGASYRYRFTQGTWDGLYLQGGLRLHNLRTQRDLLEYGAAPDGSDLRTSLKGARTSSTKPALGVGFRFTERLSVELNLISLTAQNVKGESKSGTVIELALGMHL